MPARRRRGRRGSCRSGSAPRSRSPGVTSRTSQRGEQPVGDLAYADPRALAGRRADRVRAAVLGAVDRSAAASATARPRRRTPRRGRSGTSKVTAAESSVSRLDGGDGEGVELRLGASAAAGRRRPRWSRSSDLLHVLERLEAVRAPVERLAGGGPELRGQLDGGGPAARAGERAAGGQQVEGDRPGAAAARARGRDAVLGQGGPAALGDPVAGPGRAELDPDARRRRTRRRSAGAPGRRAWWPSRGSRSRSG